MRAMGEQVAEIFTSWVERCFHKRIEELNIVIYGTELQVCGHVLRYLSKDIKAALISFDLRCVGEVYDGHECMLPEMCVPYEKNTVVLVSLLYPYQYQEVSEKLQKLGIARQDIVHARPLAEQILKISAEYFAAKAMDLRVKELFDKIGRNIADIHYLDIGANNYLLYNNTYLFYRAGARGVLVEANPDFSDILRENRPGDHVVMCGCTDRDSGGELTYFKTNRAGYNTFIEKRARSYGGGVQVLEELSIPTRSVGSILQEYFPDKHVDYLSIDVEGMDKQILRSIDFTQYDIDVILLEMDWDSDDSRELFLKLYDLGYKSRYREIGNGKDFLFYKKEVFEPSR